MAKQDTKPSTGNKDQSQKSDTVPQHKRLAQGEALKGNQGGVGVQNKT